MRPCEIVQQGPPQGPGHYSQDGRWWCDAPRQQWFRTVSGADVLEIELEDVGHASVLRSIVTTLTGQYGTQSYRFVGRARSADARWRTYAFASATFPVLPLQLPLDRLDDEAAEAQEIKERLTDLQACLEERGWRPTGRGAHWWSYTYKRPVVDWERLPASYESA